MRKPSEQLVSNLIRLNLCSAAQVASCAKQVARLGDGLPDFDSLWLDVLVQKRAITRFQADLILRGRADQLQIGTLTLRDQLGPRTLLSQARSGQAVVLQTASVSSQAEQKALEATVAGLNAKRKSAPGSLAVPIRVIGSDGDGPLQSDAVASPYVEGWTAAELVIRGGRLPWPHVHQIGVQILGALRWLHTQGSFHGNINAQTVRITPEGKAVLVGTQAAGFGSSGISLSAGPTYEDVRFLAPERILSLHSASVRCDLYSVGMVLWNLLAARDPFLSTDPVARMTKAGQTNIPDVRTVVPDCPAELATALQRLSKSNPQLRPANPDEAIELLGHHVCIDNGGLKRLVRRLPSRSESDRSRLQQSSRLTGVAPALMAAVLMTVGFVGYGVHRGLIPEVASLASLYRGDDSTAAEIRANLVKPESTERAQSNQSSQGSGRILAMPQPDAAGVVVLQSGRQYSGGDLSFPGVMHIETSGRQLAQILVNPARPWNLDARQVSVSNVHVVSRSGSVADSESSAGREAEGGLDAFASIRVKADVFSLKNSIVESSGTARQVSCIQWAVQTGTVASVRMEDCVLRSSGSAFSTAEIPQRFDLNNCLILAAKSAVRATVRKSSDQPWPLNLHRTTVPSSLTFADFLMPEAGVPACRVVMTAGECVLSPRLALLQFASVQDSIARQARMEFRLPPRGNAAVVPPGTRMAVAWDGSLKSVVEIAEDSIVGSAVLPADPVFSAASPNASTRGPWESFRLIDYEGPKLTRDMPGILVDRLPQPFGSITKFANASSE